MITSRLSCLTMIVAAALLSANAEAALVGYWQFDGDASDASGTGNDGTLNGDAGFSVNTPSGSGQSLSVDGNGDFVNIPASASLNSSAFTLSMWVNQNGAIQNGPFERLTSRGGDTFETAVSSTGQLSYWNGAWIGTGQNLPGAGWRHVMWSNDPATGMKVYVNGSLAFSGGADAANGGHMNIGARHSGVEGFQGLIDEVALYNNPVSAAGAKLLANLTAASGFDEVIQISNTTDWRISTVSLDGGPAGAWTAGAIALPDASTFTLVPTAGTLNGGVNSAATNLIGMGAQALSADNNVRFYRSTFELKGFVDIAASLSVAVDNDVAIFINGVEIAREVDFVTGTWEAPLPSLVIAPDGTITNVVKFDSVLASFNGFQVGTNEIILAVRNPNSENSPAGGFAFKLTVATTPSVPEPATAGLALIGAGGVLLAGARRRRRDA